MKKNTYSVIYMYIWASQAAKNLPANAEDTGDTTGSIPGSGRFSREGNDNPTPVFLPGESDGQRSLVGYTVHGDAKSWTQLSY